MVTYTKILANDIKGGALIKLPKSSHFLYVTVEPHRREPVNDNEMYGMGVHTIELNGGQGGLRHLSPDIKVRYYGQLKPAKF